MKCLSPITVQHADGRHVVPCGKCNFCLEARRNDWCMRLGVELRHSTCAHFITLTYDETTVPISDAGHKTLCKRDLQLFWKRLRKMQSEYTSEKIRYFICGEYGSNTDRPHYHAILFNMRLPFQAVQKCWDKGFAHSGTVTLASIRYVTKYIINRYEEVVGKQQPFCAYVS